MIGDVWAALFGKVADVIGKAVPDASKAQELTNSVVDILANEASAQAVLTGQDNVSASPFKAWWRPCLAWICVIGFALQYLVFPLLSLAGHPIVSPLDTATLNSMLYALLGLGGMRMAERIAGKA